MGSCGRVVEDEGGGLVGGRGVSERAVDAGGRIGRRAEVADVAAVVLVNARGLFGDGEVNPFQQRLDRLVRFDPVHALGLFVLRQHCAGEARRLLCNGDGGEKQCQDGRNPQVLVHVHVSPLARKRVWFAQTPRAMVSCSLSRA